MRNDLLEVTKRLSAASRYEDNYIVRNANYATEDTLIITVQYVPGEPLDQTALIEEKEEK